MAVEVPRLRGKQLEPYGDKTVVGYCVCGARWAGENLCHCSVCHLTFLSVNGFDRHHNRREGRCRTPDELTALGMEPNELGLWRKPRPPETLPRR